MWPRLVDEPARLALLRALGLLDTPPEDRFDRFTRIACRLLNAPIALVSLVDDDRQWFKANIGLSACETPRSWSFCAHAIGHSVPLIVEDARQDPRFAANPLVVDDPNIVFYAGVPLRIGGHSGLGTLCVIDHVPRCLTEEETGLLVDLAEILTSQLQGQAGALLDPLTGLLNRRGFEVAGSAMMKASKAPRALAFLDLDDFKSVNDQFGHAAGDHVLMEFARCLQAAAGDSDVVARLAGDEFVVLCTDESEGRLDRVVREVRRQLVRAGSLCRFSVGVASTSDPGTDLSALLSMADGAMYHDKGCAKPDVVEAYALTGTGEPSA